jgi:hypothetical protein
MIVIVMTLFIYRMKILPDERIVHRETLYGLHQKSKLQVAVLSHNHYIILIVFVLLIQVDNRYFYRHQILKQCQHQPEEINDRKVLIEKYHQQNEQLELNKNSFVIILHIQIFKKIVLFLENKLFYYTFFFW